MLSTYRRAVKLRAGGVWMDWQGTDVNRRSRSTVPGSSFQRAATASIICSGDWRSGARVHLSMSLCGSLRWRSTYWAGGLGGIERPELVVDHSAAPFQVT